MGVCYANDNVVRQRIMPKNMAYKYSENKILQKNKNENIASNKKYEPALVQKQDNININKINDNFNYSVEKSINEGMNLSNNGYAQIKETNNKNSDDPLSGLNLMNNPFDPVGIINKNKNSKSQTDYEKLNEDYKRCIQLYPYSNLNPIQVNQYENEYTSIKLISPYKFIENKKYSNLFSKIFQLCFLKCEPYLNNIFDDKKTSNLIFLRTVIILLDEQNLGTKINDIANIIITSSYEVNQKYINKKILISKIKNFFELCYNILFYFVIMLNYLTELEYIDFLDKPGAKLENKYSNINLDDYCLDKLGKPSEQKMENIINKCTSYVCSPLKKDNDNSEDNNDKIRDSIKEKFSNFLNAYILLRVMCGC